MRTLFLVRKGAVPIIALNDRGFAEIVADAINEGNSFDKAVVCEVLSPDGISKTCEEPVYGDVTERFAGDRTLGE